MLATLHLSYDQSEAVLWQSDQWEPGFAMSFWRCQWPGTGITPGMLCLQMLVTSSPFVRRLLTKKGGPGSLETISSLRNTNTGQFKPSSVWDHRHLIDQNWILIWSQSEMISNKYMRDLSSLVTLSLGKTVLQPRSLAYSHVSLSQGDKNSQ